MNRFPISVREFSELSEELSRLRSERQKLGQQLGELMSSSGSFAAKTPGFPETEDRIKVVERMICEINDILSITELVRSSHELPGDKITLYTKVNAISADGHEHSYYLCHRSPPTSSGTYVAVTPRSPVGRALMGRQVGDVTQVQLPKGELKLEIVSIERDIG